MTRRISRNPLIPAAVTSFAIATAALLTAGCGPASSSATPGSGSPGAGGSGSAAPAITTVSPPASPSAATAPSASGSAASGGAGSAGSGAGASASGTPDTARSDCTGDDLKVTVGSGQGAAGSSIVPVVFTNTSGGPCGIQGFPGVSLVNSGGVIGAPATRDSSRPVSIITLAPGAKASALLKIADAENYPSSTCKTDTSSSLQVYPPNETASVDVPYKGTGCRNKSVKLLQVQPVVPGSGS